MVEKESNYDPERATIAVCCLNRQRLAKNSSRSIVEVFVTGDFSLQRVLYSRRKPNHHITLT
ncbi:MAG: hypothetical protein IPO94_18210 [Saprospiraceae bacterium]|nr:hypothetical protein [Saprospiraceae bacterium]